ncbi:hypothetical protein GCK32_002098 [Trichostrongylus colubriformis]|uniref:Uncharacterized protein n=1 Tax=Trichostrongylus colubriformis TaxID=6319 RepID=A0AAN8FP06_TRICO
MYFVLLVLFPCISSHDFTDPCEISPQAEDASDFTKLIDYLNYSVNYKVDPCENFYQFACGNWIANTNGTTLMNWQEISPFTKMTDLYEQERRKVLNSTEQSKSDAITHARKFYHSCVRAQEEWNSTGDSGIDHVMGKIEKFGIFPMLSEEPFDEAQFNAKFDFTWLLAYFNQEEIVMDVIVPEIEEFEEKKMFSFKPRKSLLTFINEKTMRIYTELLLRLTKLIAADRGINYYKTNTLSDILALRTFMMKIYALSTIPIKLEMYLASRSLPIMSLGQVDGMYKVNWTEYFFLTAPPIAHSYIAKDPEVFVPPGVLIETLNKLLNETSPRTLTNFVIVSYILKQILLLEKKYTDLLEWFIAIIDSPQIFTRSGVCFTMTNTYYPVAMLAMYARSQHTEVLRPMAEEMVRAIITSLKNEVLENKWMEKAFKEAVIGKISRITWSLLDDDLFHNDTALDELYSAEYGLSDLPFLGMLTKINLIRKTKEYLELSTVELERPDPKTFSSIPQHYEVNAYYVPPLNNIMVPLPFLQFPFFDESFPRSFLYGTVGFVIGHEISHSLDVTGRKYDANGKKRKWWKKKWIEEYDKRTLCYKEQYDNVKETRTLSEPFGKH